MSSLVIRLFGVLLVASTLMFPVGALAAPQATGETVHIVQWGETLSLIADRYGVSVQAIMAANGLDDPDMIYVGQRLVIPTHGGPTYDGPSQGGQSGYHVVAAGETLTLIAIRYGTTVDALAAANGLSDTDMIYVGQKLKVPGGNAPMSGSAGGSCNQSYTVQAGDTLSGIAVQYGTTVNALMQANNLYSDFIYAGQRLCVPPGGVAMPYGQGMEGQMGPDGWGPQPGVPPGQDMDGQAGPGGWGPQPGMPPGQDMDGQMGPDGWGPQPGVPPGQGMEGQMGPGEMGTQPGMPPDQPTYYTVNPGDTLASIALRFGVSQVTILQANNLSSSAHIQVGQRLVIVTPGGGAMGGAPAPPPQYQPTDASMQVPHGEPIVIKSEPQWVGSQTATSQDPNNVNSMVVMTHEKAGLDIVIRSHGGFIAKGVSGYYYEFSWIPNFGFKGIPEGEYEVWIENEPSRVAKAKVEAGKRSLVEFKYVPLSKDVVISPGGWMGEVVENTSGAEPLGAFSILVVKTGAIGNKILISSTGFESYCITGTKPEHGEGACDLGGLNAGLYRVQLEGADVAVEVYLDGLGTATVEFRPAPAYYSRRDP